MNDIIAVVGVWLVSLVSAFISVRQPKGVDWYAPISNKQKMIMTFINISIGLLVVILTFLIIPGQLWKIVVTSGAYIIIVLFFLFYSYSENDKKKMGTPDNGDEDIDKDNISDNGKDTLLDIFSKILTVFNSMFLLMNIAYMLYVYDNIKSTIENNKDAIQYIFTNNDVLLVHGIILFWTTMSAIVITKNGWEYHKEINDYFEEKRQKKYTASFCARRITNRNG